MIKRYEYKYAGDKALVQKRPFAKPEMAVDGDRENQSNCLGSLRLPHSALAVGNL